jgi:hypothetical protein
MPPLLYTARQLDEPVALPFEIVTEALKHGQIDTEHGIMRFGSNYTFLVTVRHGAVELLAIYKPRLGEAPLWDFPEGTLCQRETAAYVLSTALGWDMVPPTVLRDDAPRGTGSVQAFINHDPSVHYFRFEERHLDQVKKVFAFDVIANNADRKGGHVLLDERDHVWGIDHGLCFNHVPKLRTVMWDFGAKADVLLAGTPVPANLLQDLEALCGQLENASSPLTQQMQALISPAEFSAMRRRVDKLLQARTFPVPGLGNSRPWPAV